MTGKIQPDEIDLNQLRAGECLLLRHDHVGPDGITASLVACVQLLDDGFTALGEGTHYRAEVVCGPDQWGEVIDVQVAVARAAIKATGCEAQRVRVVGLASNRPVGLRLYRR